MQCKRGGGGALRRMAGSEQRLEIRRTVRFSLDNRNWNFDFGSNWAFKGTGIYNMSNGIGKKE
ncbi:hypothetical protein DY000_02009727 [Brassica cretica]|uniref:Uncharacterized protein n=1 Tax=Brassica cretica TaxID=69181 RepID=A0ABQ7CGV1_BRACR|nr:hypothetical protein DY000_02009727 [Brassica cretica]